MKIKFMVNLTFLAAHGYTGDEEFVLGPFEEDDVSDAKKRAMIEARRFVKKNPDAMFSFYMEMNLEYYKPKWRLWGKSKIERYYQKDVKLRSGGVGCYIGITKWVPA